MTGATDVEAYLARLPEDARTALQSVRSLTKALVPDAEELVGYGMPGFKYRGKPLVYYAAQKQHCALYGLDVTVAARAGYETSDKGTIRFAPSAPPPESLVRELLGARIRAIETAAAKPAKSSARAKT